MKTPFVTVALLFGAFLAVSCNFEGQVPMPREGAEALPAPLEVSTAAEPALAVSGPYSHSNLSVFLLQGKDQVDTRRIVTLADAMEQKKIVVHETSEVNLLSVENVSEDADVFIQTGDIVKGGKQDRIMAFDMLVPAKSAKLPIPSYCCESGRWTKRGGEDDSRFAFSTENAGGQGFKLAVQGVGGAAGGQGEVWNQVKKAQMKLAGSVGKPVNGDSATSLQLTLENKDLLAKLEGYDKALAKVLEGKNNVIGFAVAINGKVTGAEVFGSSALFQKVWPRLLNAAAVDALANQEKDKKFEPVSSEDVEKFLARGVQEKGTEMRLAAAQQARQQDGLRRQLEANPQANSPAPRINAESQPPADATPLSLRLKYFQRDTAKTLIVESQEKGAILHRSYTAK